MKILQVTPRYPPQSGGVETHVKEISERLVRRGHEVTVVTGDAGGNVATREMRNGVAVRRNHGVAPGGAFHVSPGVAQSVQKLNAELVHAHNYHSLPVLFAALSVGDARFVITPHYHGGSASDLRNRLHSLYRPLGKWALRRADTVVAVSKWEAKQLADDFRVDATVVPNGLNVARFADANPEERSQPYLLCVGRLEEYKGVQHAIMALPSIPDYDLLVAGNGAYRDELERSAREAGVASRVTFLDYVDSDRLPGLYAGAEAFLALSSFEAYGMTVGEALAAGTPCVVRERGALVEWADRDGVVGVDSVSPEAVAKAVAVALTQVPQPESLPTWDAVVEDLCAVFSVE